MNSEVYAAAANANTKAKTVNYIDSANNTFRQQGLPLVTAGAAISHTQAAALVTFNSDLYTKLLSGSAPGQLVNLLEQVRNNWLELTGSNSSHLATPTNKLFNLMRGATCLNEL